MPLDMSLFGHVAPAPPAGQAALALARQTQQQQQMDQEAQHQRALEEHASQELAMQQEQSRAHAAYQQGMMGIAQANEARQQSEYELRAKEWQDKQDQQKADRVHKGVMDFAAANDGGTDTMMDAAAMGFPKGLHMRMRPGVNTPMADAMQRQPVQGAAPVAEEAPPAPVSIPRGAAQYGAKPGGPVKAPPGLGSFFSSIAANPNVTPPIGEPSGGVPQQILDQQEPSGESPVAPPPPAQSAPTAPPILGMPPMQYADTEAAHMKPALEPGPKSGTIYEIVDDNGNVLASFNHDKVMAERMKRIDDAFGPLVQDPNPAIANAARAVWNVAKQRTAPLDAVIKEGLESFDRLVQAKGLTAGGRIAGTGPGPSGDLSSKAGKGQVQLSETDHKYVQEAVQNNEKGGKLPTLRETMTGAEQALEMAHSKNAITQMSSLISHARVMSKRFSNAEADSLINSGGAIGRLESACNFWDTEDGKQQPEVVLRGIIEATNVLLKVSQSAVDAAGERAYHWAHDSIKSNAGSDDAAENGGRLARGQITGRYEAPIEGGGRLEQFVNRKKPKAAPAKKPVDTEGLF